MAKNGKLFMFILSIRYIRCYYYNIVKLTTILNINSLKWLVFYQIERLFSPEINQMIDFLH